MQEPEMIINAFSATITVNFLKVNCLRISTTVFFCTLWPVAQLVNALVSSAEGHGFEPRSGQKLCYFRKET